MKLQKLLLLPPMAALLCSCGDIAKLISIPGDSEEDTSAAGADSSIAFPDPAVGKSKLLELGETEGFEIAFSMTADGESEEGSSSMDFEVLSFRTGNQVTLPDLPAPTPAGLE